MGSLFLPKSRLSDLDPCISANVFFFAKKSNKLYPAVFWRSRLFPAKNSISFHSPVFRWGRLFFAKKSTLECRPVFQCKRLFSRQLNKLYPPVFWWSRLFPAKKSIFRHSPVFRWDWLLLPKSRLSYLDPGISANVVFSAKKSNKLYPPEFWRSRLFPAKNSIFTL